MYNYLNRSQTHECRNWDWGRTIPSLGIHQLDFRYSVLAADQQSCILGSKLQADWPYNRGGHQWPGNSRLDRPASNRSVTQNQAIYRSILSRIIFFDRLSILSVKRKLLIGTGCGITFCGIDRYSIVLIDGRFTNGIWNLKYTHFSSESRWILNYHYIFVGPAFSNIPSPVSS